MGRQLGKSRTPFFGMPEDMAILGSMGDGSELEPAEPEPGWTTPECTDWEPPKVHPDAVEKGVELPLGFHGHQGENRATRRRASATWAPPKNTQEGAAGGTAPAPAMPTRRELFEQRRKHQRGKLDPELRRLQRKALKK